MAFQQNGFQHNGFQVQVSSGGAVVGTPVRTMMGVGLGVRLLATVQLKEDVSRRKLAQLLTAILLPWKK